MIIILNEAEQKLARFIATSRETLARKRGVHDAKVGPQSGASIDLEGAGSEIAFAKLTNTYPDLEVGHTPDADCYTIAHGAVDVKSTKYRNGRLLARKEKAAHAPDSYALLIGEFPRYKFVGWVPASELLQDATIVDLGHGEGHGLSQAALVQTL